MVERKIAWSGHKLPFSSFVLLSLPCRIVPSFPIQHTFNIQPRTYIINVVLRETSRRINSLLIWAFDGRMKNINRVNYLFLQPKITPPTSGSRPVFRWFSRSREDNKIFFFGLAGERPIFNAKTMRIFEKKGKTLLLNSKLENSSVIYSSSLDRLNARFLFLWMEIWGRERESKYDKSGLR